MRCERCGEREAVVRYRRRGDSQRRGWCEPCLEALRREEDPSLTPLQTWMEPDPTSPLPPPRFQLDPPQGDPVCPVCGLDWQAFSATERLGCPRCYETFAEPLRRIYGPPSPPA